MYLYFEHKYKNCALYLTHRTCDIDIDLLTAIGFSPGGSTHPHTNNTHNNTNNNRITQIQPSVEE
jgi:hypothetical protein